MRRVDIVVDEFLFKGTIYLIKDIDFARQLLNGPCKYILLNVDDTDHLLSSEFPNQVQQSTILCPPPSVIYREIDGDTDGFVNGYTGYLASKEVDDFISMIMCCLHRGINLLLYVADYSDESVWLNTLLSYIFSTYGIKIGTSKSDKFDFDIRYIGFDIDRMFVNGHMDRFEYMTITPHSKAPMFDKDLVNRIRSELSPFSIPGMDPMYLFDLVKSKDQNVVVRPAIMF